MAPLIRAVLSTLIGEQDASEIEIIANEVDIFHDGKWDIHYRHPSRWVQLAERRHAPNGSGVLKFFETLCLPIPRIPVVLDMTSPKPFSRTAVSRSLPSYFSLVTACQVSKED